MVLRNCSSTALHFFPLYKNEAKIISIRVLRVHPTEQLRVNHSCQSWCFTCFFYHRGGSLFSSPLSYTTIQNLLIIIIVKDGNLLTFLFLFIQFVILSEIYDHNWHYIHNIFNQCRLILTSKCTHPHSQTHVWVGPTFSLCNVPVCHPVSRRGEVGWRLLGATVIWGMVMSGLETVTAGLPEVGERKRKSE